MWKRLVVLAAALAASVPLAVVATSTPASAAAPPCGATTATAHWTISRNEGLSMRKRLFTLLIALVSCISVSTVLAGSPAMAVVAPACSATTGTASWSTQGLGTLHQNWNYSPGHWCMKASTLSGLKTEVIFQGDGNLVWYGANNINVGIDRVLWASGTNGRGAARLSFQVDGNIVIYTANNTVLWAIGASSSRNSSTRFSWRVTTADRDPCVFGFFELRHFQTNPDINPLHLKTIC